jgi:gamma-glutamyltranspeptidase/glutathione hydrolase
MEIKKDRRDTFPAWEKLRFALLALALVLSGGLEGGPLTIQPVVSQSGIVVAGHPEAAAVGAAILSAGGNAIDAAVGVSLTLGAAEPYGSGLGGKLMLLYYDAESQQAFVVDGMDQAGLSLETDTYRRLPEVYRYNDWSAVAVPGLPFALHAAHARWGRVSWAEAVQPAITVARQGPLVLEKNRVLFAEREGRLRDNSTLRDLYMPGGELPAIGTRLPHPQLATSMEVFAREGIAAFRDGPLAQAIVTASQEGGGHLTMEDFIEYEARFPEPIEVGFGPYQLMGSPPPSVGATLAFAMLKLLEGLTLEPPLRSAGAVDLIGRAWRLALPIVRDEVSEGPHGLDVWENFLSVQSVEELRHQLRKPEALAEPSMSTDSGNNDATTHFVVADADGNVVSATQSLSLHFGAGVIASGIILNNTMSNFVYEDPHHPNFVAPGKRPRSTITPTIVLRDARPVLALGAPGGQRIPSAVVQVLLDHLVLKRPLSEAIGDTRLHWFRSPDSTGPDIIEAESSLAEGLERGLDSLGWKVNRREEHGTGRHFGGVNAVSLRPDGRWEGFADPRRSNAVAIPSNE